MFPFGGIRKPFSNLPIYSCQTCPYLGGRDSHKGMPHTRLGGSRAGPVLHRISGLGEQKWLHQQCMSDVDWKGLGTDPWMPFAGPGRGFIHTSPEATRHHLVPRFVLGYFIRVIRGSPLDGGPGLKSCDCLVVPASSSVGSCFYFMICACDDCVLKCLAWTPVSWMGNAAVASTAA